MENRCFASHSHAAQRRSLSDAFEAADDPVADFVSTDSTRATFASRQCAQESCNNGQEMRKYSTKFGIEEVQFAVTGPKIAIEQSLKSID